MRSLLFALLAFAALTQAAKQPIVETDLLKIGKVSELKVTPDGNFAIFGVLTVNTTPPATTGGDPMYEYRTNLWMADLRYEYKKPIRLTFGDRSDSALAISPNGEMLAFVRADEKKKPQLWTMTLHEPGEAREITSLEYGVAGPRGGRTARR